jgi:TolB-like protein/Tfp pilus assembly protein PilF
MVRRLTAIMFTDMVGYTALMQENELLARDQRARQRAVLEARIVEHGGRILEIHGDGTLSVFPSAVQAVESAVAIQQDLTQGSPVPLRIGVHSGDVVHDDDGVYGDGVNVAARVQALSVPGGVLVSAKVADELKNQPTLRTRDLGAFRLKNVKQPLGVHAVTTGGLEVPDEDHLGMHRTRGERSVAVLPFVNMSADPENEFFSDGVTEEILNALTYVKGLHVTARTSSFAYKGRNVDVRKIGNELGVASILEGSVRRVGNRVRLTVQLIDTADGYHRFSQVYDREIGDIFDTQDEIARTIVGQLHVPLMGQSEYSRGPAIHLTKPHRHDTAAYTEYLKGLAQWRRWTPEGARAAIAAFERSAALDPDCALPLSGVAEASLFLGSQGLDDPRVALPRAEAAARRAVELEPSLGESHLALAAVQFLYLWDFRAACQSFRRALELTPGSAEAHHLYGMYLRAMGDLDQATERMETAERLDPLSMAVMEGLGRAYLASGRAQDAVHQLQRTLELGPGFRPAVEALGWAHLMAGDPERALAAFQSYIDRTGHSLELVPHRAFALIQAGRPDAAAELRAVLERATVPVPGAASAVDDALLHLAFGEKEEGLDALEQAVGQRMGEVIFLPENPMVAQLEDHPRYHALMERIGLPVRTLA